MHRSLLPSVVIAVASLLAIQSRAADAPEAPKSAADVFSRYLAASGGKEAVLKVQSRIQKGSFEVPALAATGKYEGKLKRPSLVRWSVSGDFGKFEAGSDGKTGWGVEPNGNVREMSEGEVASAHRDSDLHLPLTLPQQFQKTELKGEQTVDGRKLHLVEGVRNGKTEKLYFDPASGLLARWEREDTTQMGAVDSVRQWSDYRAVDGVQVAFVQKYASSQLAWEVKIAEITQNTPVEDSAFKKPNP